MLFTKNHTTKVNAVTHFEADVAKTFGESPSANETRGELYCGKLRTSPSTCPGLRCPASPRAIAVAILACGLIGSSLLCSGLPSASAQAPDAQPASVPSLEAGATAGTAASGGQNSKAASPLQSRRTGGAPPLPTDAGQYWEEYDLRPYTRELSQIDRPQQAIIDWILRETGTDPWFTDPFGFINADRETLRVYHNQEMHQVIRDVYERFVNGTTAPQLYGLRLMAIGNPNWRTRAHQLMRSVRSQSPGVQAFLVSKENSAILLAMLRGRTDFQELSSVDVVVHNGQAQVLEQLRGRNFIEDYKTTPGAWPPYMPSTGEIKEGYRLQLSPLLSVDKQTVDLVVKCNIDQVERLANVNLDLPLPTGQSYTGQINVPQVASWRLHERFRWPADEVLVLSCGVVAAPMGSPNGSLLGQGTSLLGLDRILPSGDRADALLVIEYRGDASGRIPTSGARSGNTAQPTSPLSRGRY